MLLILQIAINVVSFLYFDTKGTECDIKLGESNGIYLSECAFPLPSCTRDYS